MKFKTSGTCCSEINLEIEDDIIQSVEFKGGCNGNLQGIASLVTGMNKDEVIKKLEGVNCGMKSTSCPDQLAKALKEWRP